MDVVGDEFVGRDGPEAAREAETEGWIVRVLAPGSMMTMDYREDRLNLHVSDDGVVERTSVG